MKVIAPSLLVAEGAAVVAPCSSEVIVIGAAALQITLADDLGCANAISGATNTTPVDSTRDFDTAVITPTRDVDLAIRTERAEEIVRHLERVGLVPSQEPFEQGYTWVRDDLKIQLVRPYHPFPPEAAARMPQNPALSLLDAEQHSLDVAFEDAPDARRLRCTTPAALVALKEVAFGRRRPDGTPIERDYHDVFLVLDRRADDLERSYRDATVEVRPRVDRAVNALADGGEATQAAARQQALITGDPDLERHQLVIRRAALLFQRRVAPDR